MGVCVCWRGGSYEAPVYNLSLLITIFAKGKMDYFYIKIQFSDIKTTIFFYVKLSNSLYKISHECCMGNKVDLTSRNN